MSSIKQVEVVRKKSEREALPGHTCPDCQKYVEAMVEQGIYTRDEVKDRYAMISLFIYVCILFVP